MQVLAFGVVWPLQVRTESLTFDLRMRPVVIKLANRSSNAEGGWWVSTRDDKDVVRYFVVYHTLQCS
jgi:hypothetical protein